jgi:hypothetical protein
MIEEGLLLQHVTKLSPMRVTTCLQAFWMYCWWEPDEMPGLYVGLIRLVEVEVEVEVLGVCRLIP